MGEPFTLSASSQAVTSFGWEHISHWTHTNTGQAGGHSQDGKGGPCHQRSDRDRSRNRRRLRGGAGSGSSQGNPLQCAYSDYDCIWAIG